MGDSSRRRVPELAVTLSMVLTAASLVLFVVFLHHAVRSLNASVVIRRIAADGHDALAKPYPDGVGRPADGGKDWEPEGEVTAVRAPRAGYVVSSTASV